MQLMRGNLLSHRYVSGCLSLWSYGPGPVATPGVPSAVLRCFTPCFFAQTAQKSQQNAVLTVSSVGKQEKKISLNWGLNLLQLNSVLWAARWQAWRRGEKEREKKSVLIFS